LQRYQCKVCFFFLAKCLVKITTGESPLYWPTSYFIAMVKLSIVPLHERKLSGSFIFRPLRDLDHSRLTSVKPFVCVLFLFPLEEHWGLYILAKLFRPEGKVFVELKDRRYFQYKWCMSGLKMDPADARGTKYPAGRISRRNSSYYTPHRFHIPVVVGHWWMSILFFISEYL